MEKNILNKKQEIAVKHFKGPMLVLAGPGSGKTTVIIHRVKNLIENNFINPANILVITFTKAAAVEMEKRFLQLNIANKKAVSFGTFHSLFFRIIRDAYNYNLESIIKEEEKWNFLRETLKESNFEVNDEDEFIRDFLTEVSFMKNELKTIKNFEPHNVTKDEFEFFYKKYEDYKTRLNKIDFDDMLTYCYEVLNNDKILLEKWRNKYKYILIDEFQDINKAQYECIKLLSYPENNIFAVGDDDQSIYKFRGSRPEFFLSFPKEFQNTQKVILDINYRSTKNIIRVATRIIRNNKKRFDKDISGVKGEGNKTTFFIADNNIDEACRISNKIEELNKKGVSNNEIAVIFRTNMQASIFTRIFTDCGIEYNLRDNITNIYEHWSTKDICAYMRLALNREDNYSLLRIINKPKRYISRNTMDFLKKSKGCILDNIYLQKEVLKNWQIEKFQDLELYLKQIKKRKPYEAIKYIRNVIGYDDYIDEYSKLRHINILAIKEIENEIMDTAKELEDFYEFFDKLETLSKNLKENKQNFNKEKENAVTLSTIHSSKGLEFEAVFIPGIIERILPHEKSKTLEEIEEERRLFYVGITRAKNFLYLSEIKERYDKETERSRFLSELGIKGDERGKKKSK